MESFILGSEWDLIFLLCFVAQTIQSIIEIWIFKKHTFFKFWKKSLKLFIVLVSHMKSFILRSECWKFGSLDMEWPISNHQDPLICGLL
jgi:phage-related holin